MMDLQKKPAKKQGPWSKGDLYVTSAHGKVKMWIQAGKKKVEIELPPKDASLLADALDFGATMCGWKDGK